MLIGKDYPKIEFEFLGLDLLEPNTFIGDVIIVILALYFAYKVNKISIKTPYFIYWKWFFIVFGTGFFIGGLAHLFFNYWGIPGKYTSWYSGIIASFLVEYAMISIHPIQKIKTILKKVIWIKLTLALVIETLIFIKLDLNTTPALGLIVPTVNSVIGLGLTLGILGYYYQKKIDSSFKYLWISTLILIPSALFQSLKINFHQWFDKNDVSHILLIIGLILYYISIRNYSKNLLSKK